MKLCFLADAQSTHTKKWVMFFVSQGYEVHLISFRKAHIPNIIFHPLRATFPIRISPVAPTYSKVGYVFHLQKCRRLVHEIAPDILHAHWASSYGLMGAYSKYHPFVLSTWGRDVFDFPHKSFLHRKILESTINRADYLTATSRMLAQETQRYVKKETKVQVIPFGVNLKQFKSKISNTKETITIGTVKSLEKKYGIEYLIRAFALLSPAYAKLKLMIVGTGSLEKELKQLCRVLKVEHNVNFEGYIDNSRVPDYLNQMDIFVVPSTMASETFGVAAVEAAACKVPVIASEIGGLPEVVIDARTGFLVPPQNPDAIAEKIALLIENMELRKSMGEAGRKFVEEYYDWEENAREMEKLYVRAAEK